jgi:antitoxin component YwqK of YwqJK toxin-antitoxin module
MIKKKGREKYMREGHLDGYWEWFRKDGTKMRSGFFNLEKIGEWNTYDRNGNIYKTTTLKSRK